MLVIFAIKSIYINSRDKSKHHPIDAPQLAKVRMWLKGGHTASHKSVSSAISSLIIIS